MENTLLELLVFIAGMGFIEGFVKPFSIVLFRRSLELLPEIFDTLDPLMPEYIAKLSPDEMRAKVYETVDKIANKREVSLSEAERERLFKEFVSRFDPLVASSKAGV